MRAILQVHQVFKACLPQGSLEDWTPTYEEGHMVLEVSNRYYTAKKDLLDEEIPFSDQVDPLSILQRQMPSYACHAGDNEVLYFELISRDKK